MVEDQLLPLPLTTVDLPTLRTRAILSRIIGWVLFDKAFDYAY
jgi:hypothetical protein